MSYGTSSYGYDIRCAPEFKVFTNIHSTVVDPKNFDEKSFVDIEADVCIIPPNSFALARTVEYFRIPRNVLTICLGKSTYARCGIIVNVTPFEPEWEGYVTLEFSNTTPLPAKIYAGEGLRAGAVLRERRGLRDQLQGSRRQIPGQRGVTLPKTWEAAMKWEGERQSDNVEDRRDAGPSGGGGFPIGGRGIGLGTIVIALVGGWILGINPLTLLSALSGGGMPDSAVVQQAPRSARRPTTAWRLRLHRAGRYRGRVEAAVQPDGRQLPRPQAGAVPRRHADRLRHRPDGDGPVLLPG